MKIRGTAHHIGEKYLQLARDAQLSGDPVMAESYLQHAEHYFRLIATAQQAQQQAAYGYQRPPGEPESDDDGDEDFDSLPDRFASPSEQRAAQQPQQAAPQQPYQERQSYNNGGGQPYEARPQQNYDRNNQPQPQPQPHYDRPPQQGYDRGNQEPRGYDNRRGGNGHQQDRGGQDKSHDRNNQDRNNQDRNGQDRGQGYQGGQQQDRAQPDRAPQQDRGQQQDRQPRDYDNRNFRGRDRGPRDVRDGAREQRAAAQEDEQPNVGLPAFITGPTRSLPETSAHEAEPERHVTDQAIPHEASADAGEETPHLRPRRRRRPKSEFAGSEGETQPQPEETSAGD